MYAIKCTQLCHCSAGSDTPQGLVLRGLIPRKILFCGVSDPNGKLRPCRTRRKSFESLPFSLKGHFLKIGFMFKLHYPRHTGFMLIEPPIWKFFLCSAGSDTPQNNFDVRISPRIRTRIRKCFRVWIRGLYRVDSLKKTRGQKSCATVPLNMYVTGTGQHRVQATSYSFCEVGRGRREHLSCTVDRSARHNKLKIHYPSKT